MTVSHLQDVRRYHLVTVVVFVFVLTTCLQSQAGLIVIRKSYNLTTITDQSGTGRTTKVAEDAVERLIEANGNFSEAIGNEVSIEGAKATARGSINYASVEGGSQLQLKLEAFASAVAVTDISFQRSGQAYADLKVAMEDWVRLTGNGVLPNNDRTLKFIWDFDGLIDKASFNGDLIGELNASARVEMSSGNASGFLEARYERNQQGIETGSPGDFRVKGGIGLLLDDNLRLDFRAGYNGHSHVFIDGLSLVASLNTAKLVGVTFADGTTPEERGFALEFGSGLTSPNLLITSVPEPSSVMLLSTVGTGLLWRRMKVRRRAA